MFFKTPSRQLKKVIANLPEYQKFKTDKKWYKPKEFKPFLSDLLAYRAEVDLFNRNLDKYLTSLDSQKQATRERFLPKEILINSRNLEISNKLVRTYYLAELPSIASITQLIGILNLPIPFTISYHLKGTKKSKIITRSNSKISALEAQLISEKERGKYRNKEVEKHIDEINRFSDDIISGSQEAFYLSVYVTIQASSKKQLAEYDKIFKEETQDIQYFFNNCFLNQEKSLQDTLPIIANQSLTGKTQHLVHTDGICNLLPFLSKNTTDHEGIFLGSNLHNGSLVLVDLFKTDNANFNIFGKSGSGKSVTSKLIISRLLLRGVQNIIIDPEGEYTNLANNYGGEVVEFSRDRGINPFYIFTDTNNSGDSENTEGEIQNQILILKEFFRFFISKDKYDSGLIGKLLSEYFKETKAKNRNLNNFFKFLKKQNKTQNFEFYEDLQELSGSRSLGGYFNSSQEIDLNKELICFNLRKLETDEVKIPAMYILTSLVQKLADDKSKRKMIYVDEAHLLLKHKITGQFLQALSKTVRKRNTGLVCISQELEDFKEENGGKTIIAQAESNFILKQSNISVNHIREKKILPLTEDELRQLTSMQRGQCIYIRQSEHLLLQVVPFEAETDLVYT